MELADVPAQKWTGQDRIPCREFVTKQQFNNFTECFTSKPYLQGIHIAANWFFKRTFSPENRIFRPEIRILIYFSVHMTNVPSVNVFVQAKGI